METIRWIGYVLFGIYVICSLWLLLNALAQLHLLWIYKRKQVKEQQFPPAEIAALPFVTIQVPVYNEKYVIERLLEAIAALDYPRHLLEVQVLDDSTDETSEIIDRKAAALQDQVVISILRRNSRKGYKAGALQEGLPHTAGELIAIFDADFIPPKDFLLKTVPFFADSATGLVQARWTHLNRDENMITRVQSFLLDTHFSVEQNGRYKAGYFINFCGTAGVWRKKAIEEAGGWDGNVLSEDLDLSYRAQLRGWKMVYLPELEVPAELPAAMEAFRIQQFRWTKGMAQISRKSLGRLLQSDLSIDKKIHGFFHLMGSFVFVCLFINSILTLPLLVLRNIFPEFISLTHFILFTSFNLVFLTIIYYHGIRSSHSLRPLPFLKNYPLFLMVYMALSVQNAIAVIQGLSGSVSAFIRTPKSNRGGENNNAYLSRKLTWMEGLECFLLIYFIGGIALSFYLQDYFMLLFFLMIGFGLSFNLFQTLRNVIVFDRNKNSLSKRL